jgi:hypothetical protein
MDTPSGLIVIGFSRLNSALIVARISAPRQEEGIGKGPTF